MDSFCFILHLYVKFMPEVNCRTNFMTYIVIYCFFFELSEMSNQY